MKLLFTLTILLFSWNSYGQTHVLEKNLERARLHQNKQINSSKSSEFQLKSGEISSGLLLQIANAMEQKDGYIEVSKTESNLVMIKYESYIRVEDVLDVINQFGFTFTLSTTQDIRL